MKTGLRRFLVTLGVVLACGMMLGLKAGGPRGERQEGDKTLSPYFVVLSEDPQVESLPLKGNQAEVKIAGVVAEVKLTQFYQNTGKKPLEAIYVFPASTRAAVHAMRMTIGERVIEAEVMERQKARQTYEEAKQEGKTTSLLEQQRPNVFQMNVANILPGDQVRVELRYIELLTPQDKQYEFVLPTVVGPRYSNLKAEGAPDTEKWVQNPYLREGQAPPYSYGVNVSLNSGVPIAAVASPSHDVAVKYQGPSHAEVKLKDEAGGGNKDFVLRYSLAGGQIETGMLLYPGKEDNYFLMLMEPPARSKAEAVLPREYIFIVDVSGSMHGFPLDTAKALMEKMLGGLKPQEFLNVLLFESKAAVLSPDGSLPASEENKQRAYDWIRQQPGGGGTEILAALRQALALPRTTGTSRTVVVITDGYVHVEPEAFELVRKSLGEANLFAFGVGKGVNRFLIEGLARTGQGEPFFVLGPQEAAARVKRFQEYVAQPLLTDIKVSFEGFGATALEPEKLPDLFAERPLTLVGKYRGSPGGAVVVRGKTAQGPFEKRLEIKAAQASEGNAALRLLWARERIKRLADLNFLRQDDHRVKEVTELGITYNLLTPYTSFVAVDKVKRADGQLVTVKQPLPLPEGVSDLAVGGGGPLRKSMAAPPGSVGYASRVMGIMPESKGAPRGGVKLSEESETAANVRVRVAKVMVQGELAEADVRQALVKALPSLSACAQAEQQRKGKLPREVWLRFNIGTDGKVTWLKMAEAPAGFKTLEACLLQAVAKVPFPSGLHDVVRVRVKLMLEVDRLSGN